MGEPAVVHGDFRMGNFLIDRDGLTAVLDWELAHRGDPVEDLGLALRPGVALRWPRRPSVGSARGRS